MAVRKAMVATIGFVLGAVVGNALPNPTDPLFIWINHWLAVNQASIPVWQYWLVFGVNYYLLTALWYIGLLFILVFFSIRIEEKTFLVAGLISAGSVVGLLGLLMTGQNLPGVTNVNLGIYITLGVLGAFAGLGAALVLYLRGGGIPGQ